MVVNDVVHDLPVAGCGEPALKEYFQACFKIVGHSTTLSGEQNPSQFLLWSKTSNREIEIPCTCEEDKLFSR